MSGDAGTVSRDRRVWGPRLLAISALLLVAAGLALGSPRTSASPGWELILDLPGTAFQGIDFVSDSEGWLAAGAGLLHTTDGGVTWQEAVPIPGQHIDFADPTHGWLVGYDGTIYGTSDGVTWSQQESGTKVHLTDVFAVGPQEAWVVGTGLGFSDVVVHPPPGVLLHTTDGGTTWQQIETPATSWFQQITFVGQKGWAVGQHCDLRPDPANWCAGPTAPALLHTEDGGDTWALLETNLPGVRARPRHLVFVDENNGWVTQSIPNNGWIRPDIPEPGGFHAVLLSTSDGGTNWQPVNVGPLAAIGAVTFRDALEGWVLAADCGGVPSLDPCPMVFLSTVDGGESWTSQPIDLRQDYTFELLATDATLFLTGPGNLGASVALRSTDGGAGWQAMTHPALDLREIDFVDAEVGYALSSSGYGRPSTAPDLYRTDDAGRSWQRIGPVPVDWNGKLAFRDAQHGFSAGSTCSQDQQCVLKISATSDGGQSWETVFSESPGVRTFPVSFQFADDAHGWFVGDSGFLITQDGGRTWTQQPIPFDHEFVGGTDLVEGGHAWTLIATHTLQTLARSQDGGKSWEIIPEPGGSDETVIHIDFVDSSHGWSNTRVCGVDSCRANLLATQDGGETWEELGFSGERSFIETLAFVDRVNGWLIGGNCEGGCNLKVFRTADGGRTWVSQLTPQRYTRGNTRNITFVDAETAWVWFPSSRPVGLGGGLPLRMQIFHTTDAGGGTTGIAPPDTGSASPPSGAAFPLPLILTLAALGWGLIATAVLGRGQHRRS